MSKVSRREFLFQVATAMAAAELAHHSIIPSSVQAAEVTYPLVAVSQGTNDDSIETILRTALAGIGGIERFVKPGQVVAIKPNATWAFRPHTGSATDPELLKALIAMVKGAGAKQIIVMDHCSIDPGTAEALRLNGLGKVVDEAGVDKLFPDRFNAPRSTYVKIDLPRGKVFKNLGVIKAAIEADVRINVALAKSHNVTKYSMSLKHLMGLLEVPQNLHIALEQGIADINGDTPIKPVLNILEAIRVRMPWGEYRVCAGPETDLSHPNIVKRLNQVVAGTDPVLVDSYGCVEYFKIIPEELTHLLRSAESGVGKLEIVKAISDGTVRIFKAGQPIPPMVPTPTATTAAVAPQSTPTYEISTTATPLPTSTPVPEVAEPVMDNTGGCASCAASQDEVVNPNTVLSGALIPAAAIVLGAGLLAANRLAWKDKVEDADAE